MPVPAGRSPLARVNFVESEKERRKKNAADKDT
jgi:hypothetical protein